MPFASSAQRGYLWANHPEVAREFQAATPKGAKLPRHVGKSVKPTTQASKAAAQAVISLDELLACPQSQLLSILPNMPLIKLAHTGGTEKTPGGPAQNRSVLADLDSEHAGAERISAEIAGAKLLAKSSKSASETPFGKLAAILSPAVAAMFGKEQTTKVPDSIKGTSLDPSAPQEQTSPAPTGVPNQTIQSFLPGGGAETQPQPMPPTAPPPGTPPVGLPGGNTPGMNQGPAGNPIDKYGPIGGSGGGGMASMQHMSKTAGDGVDRLLGIAGGGTLGTLGGAALGGATGVGVGALLNSLSGHRVPLERMALSGVVRGGTLGGIMGGMMGNEYVAGRQLDRDWELDQTSQDRDFFDNELRSTNQKAYGHPFGAEFEGYPMPLEGEDELDLIERIMEEEDVLLRAGKPSPYPPFGQAYPEAFQHKPAAKQPVKAAFNKAVGAGVGGGLGAIGGALAGLGIGHYTGGKDYAAAMIPPLSLGGGTLGAIIGSSMGRGKSYGSVDTVNALPITPELKLYLKQLIAEEEAETKRKIADPAVVKAGQDLQKRVGMPQGKPEKMKTFAGGEGTPPYQIAPWQENGKVVYDHHIRGDGDQNASLKNLSSRAVKIAG